MAVLAGKVSARRKDCAPLAGKSTLNGLEPGAERTRHHCIAWAGQRSRRCFVDLFLEPHQRPPNQIILGSGSSVASSSMEPVLGSAKPGDHIRRRELHDYHCARHGTDVLIRILSPGAAITGGRAAIR